MNHPIPSLSRQPWLLIAFLALLCPNLRAETFGLFTYSVSNGEVTITDYPDDATGTVEIPAEIDGLPVTNIGGSAASECRSLTSQPIPGSVTRLGDSMPEDTPCAGATTVVINAPLPTPNPGGVRHLPSRRKKETNAKADVFDSPFVA